MYSLWHLHRRAVLMTAGGFVVLVALAVVVAAVVRLTSGHTKQATPALPSAPKHTSSTSDAPNAPTDPASDVGTWNAMPAIKPATSAAYPAIVAAARTDAAAFARAFATELFTRDYAHSDRQAVLSWAQAEDAPLRSPRYPRRDWSKVLVDSLTDLTWDRATQTPVPSSGVWDVLASSHARDAVSAVSVRTDPQWENTVAQGYQSPDPLTSIQDVSLRVTRTAVVHGRATTSRTDIEIAIQVGTAPDGGYGAAATNNFVARQEG